MSWFLNQTQQLFKYLIFWISYFLLSKLLFLLFNWNQSSQLSILEILKIFGFGLIMDISTSFYLLLIPSILLVFSKFLSKVFINRFIYIYTIIVLIVSSFLSAIDLGLYPHWGTRIGISAFNYINDPVAMQASVSWLNILSGLILIVSSVLILNFLYRKLFIHGISCQLKIGWYEHFLQLILISAFIIPIRGGFDTSPLNLSSVAFSSNLFVNQAATNYMWNFGKSLEKNNLNINPCHYMPTAEAEVIFTQFMARNTRVESPDLFHIDSNNPPNVVLIILESFSNNVIQTLGGKGGIAPNLDTLVQHSTVFTNFYATGNRSDRGISALLGAYPSLLTTSVMVFPEKAKGLTLLPEYFNRHDYFTSFYYGGDINFYNLKTFILQSNCKKIITKDDFPSELGRMSKWGVPDEYIFERAFQDLKVEKSPFMKTIYTISSHSPYDVPFYKVNGNSINSKYLNSVAYTDSCLGKFIRDFKKFPQWENTLLIITADHSTLHAGISDVTDPASYRIPLILTGGAIDSLYRIETITQQIDFSNTLISQFGWDTDSPRFCGHFFSKFPHAFYMLDSGWGYVIPEGSYYFDQNNKDYKETEAKNGEVDLISPKAYMQVLHDDFIHR